MKRINLLLVAALSATAVSAMPGGHIKGTGTTTTCPSSITGHVSQAVGDTATLTTNSSTNGTWLSSDLSVATVVPSAGVFTLSTALAPGTSIITFQSAGCPDVTKVFHVHSPLTACTFTPSVTVTNVSCNGGTDGAVVVTGGTGVLSYSVYNYDLAAGTYSTIVSDENGCTADVTATITEPKAISATVTAGTILCHGGTAAITVTATGGTGTLTNDAPATVYAGGPYTYTVTDANHCTATTNAITVTEPAAISASVSASDILCFGGTAAITVTATGGTGTLTNNAPATVYAGGPYSYTVIDANGCTAVTNSITVTQPTKVVAAVNPANSCLTTGYGATSVTLTATGTGGTGTIAPVVSVVSPVTTSLSCVAYTYTLTVTDANGCTAAASATVNTRNVECSAGNSNIKKVNVYHNNGGKKGYNVLCVDASAVPAHLAHGDELGNGTAPCCGVSGGAKYGNMSAEVTAADFKVFPNPAHGSCTIEMPAMSTDAIIIITDMTGRTVATRVVVANNTTAEFDLANVTTGMYIVKINAGSEVFVSKLIVE